VIDRPYPETGLGTPLTRRSTWRQAERLRQVPTALYVTGTYAACLASKARRGGHDLLSRGLERATGPRRHAGPAHLGTAGR